MMNNFVKNTRFPCQRDLSNPFVKVGTDQETPAAAGATMMDHLRMFKDTYNNQRFPSSEAAAPVMKIVKQRSRMNQKWVPMQLLAGNQT